MIGIEHWQRRITALDDAELVRAAQNGDATSLGLLLERHRAALYALALRFLGRRPEAQEADQSTFLIALNIGRNDRNRRPSCQWPGPQTPGTRTIISTTT